MKDWSMSYRQTEETTKKKGVANDCVTRGRERLYLFHFSFKKHWDKCSCFLWFTEKTRSGRMRPYNVQLTVVNNNNKTLNL